MTDRDSSVLEIDIVICTYNRAARLDAVLATLEQQVCEDQVTWRVLVVDNASTDDTAQVVSARSSKKSLPGLRRVFEPRQGLTFARQRGAHETSAPWIAYVDDDNFLAPTWLSAVGRAIRLHRFGRVIGISVT